MYSDDEMAGLLSALVGSVLAVIVGYFAYAVERAERVSFYYWIQEPFGRGWAWWAIGGAVIGGLVGYLRQQHEP